MEISKLSKQIQSEIEEIQSIKIKKSKFVFNPVYNLTEVVEENPVDLVEMLLEFGYLNTFEPNDKNYAHLINETPKKIFNELGGLDEAAREVKARIKEKMIKKIEEHLESGFDQLNW